MSRWRAVAPRARCGALRGALLLSLVVSTSTQQVCAACAPNTYCAGARDQATACPPFSSSPSGSTLASACRCLPGFTGADGGECAACAGGTFKAAAGSAACNPCPANSWSLPGSDAGADCKCDAGYTGQDGAACSACAEGKFKDAPGDAACVDCPTSSSSPVGSDALTDCKCPAGFTGADGGACTACVAGKFKTTAGSAACASCPANAESAEASDEATDCKCSVGFTGANGGACTACAAGKFKTTAGSAACASCLANSESAEASDAQTDCQCRAGFTGADGGACTACEAGKFKTTAGSAACQACPAFTSSAPASDAPADCKCLVGYTGPDGNACAPCGANTFKDAPGDAACTSCPANAESSSASDAQADCKCAAGFTGEDGGTCTACAAGKFKTAAGSAACASCPEFSWSLPGSDAPADCKCLAGYTGADGGTCAACAAGKFKSALGSAECSLCPANAASPAASDALTDCLCAAGFAGGAGETCVECAADTFEAGDACLPCPINSVSAPRSAGASACKCKPGYSGPDGGDCVACARGLFKALAGAAACVFCSEHASTLDLAATDATECRCTPGFAPSGNSATGVTCAPCAANTYKNTTANAACAPCTPHSSAPAGSRNVSMCRCDAEYVAAGDGSCDRVCAAGFEAAGGADGEAFCAGCAPSTFKADRGDHPCEACPANAFSNARNQTSVYSCLCEAGHAWTRAEAGVACVACAAGTFNSLVNATTCYTCDSGGGTQTACPGLVRAPAGFEAVAETGGIRACPVNHFQDGTSNVCTKCPEPSTYTAQGGLTSVLQCVCVEGYERSEGVCIACSTLSYKGVSGDGPCSACTANSQTLTPARTSALACLCNPGYQAATGTCVACGAGKTKLSLSNTDQCVQCPSHSTLRLGAQHLSEKCECNPGYYNSSTAQELSDCRQCTPGSYATGYGAKTCQSCPLFATSPPAAAAITACQCIANYEAGLSGGPESGHPCVATCGVGKKGSAGICAACEKGKFKSTIGTACSSCPGVRTASAAGATAASKCSCPKGKVGIKQDDMVVVEGVGGWDTSDSLLETAPVGQELVYEPALDSPRIWKLSVAGPAGVLSVRVNENLVFQCALWNGCRDVVVDLRGTRGRVRASSSTGVIELHAFKQRQVVLRQGPYMTLSSEALAQVRAWAAQGRLRPGDAVFRAKNVFTESECSECPRGLACRDPIAV